MSLRFCLRAVPFLALPLVSLAAGADAPRWVTQLVRSIPRSDEEFAAAFEKSRNSSIQVPVGEPLQVPGFAEQTVYDVTIGGKKQRIPFDYSRLGALTFGLSVAEPDQANLPAVSKNTILDRVNTNYISIQVRPQRDVETGAIYLYYKPFAAIGIYGQPNSHEFSPLMEDSVRDLRGLGLFVPKGTPVTAEALRTFVAINKTTICDPENRDAPQPKTMPHYELLLVRAVVDGEKVELHTFCTTEWRTLLHYMKPYAEPATIADCGIKSVMLFTDYSVAKQSPSAMAQRHTYIRPQGTFRMEDLDAYASASGFEGGALDNLTAILDAIIARKVSPAEGIDFPGKEK